MAYQAYRPPPSPQPYSEQPYSDRDVSPAREVSNSQLPPPPPPPVHRTVGTHPHPVGMHPQSQFTQLQREHNTQHSPPLGVTPGADNLGERAAGGGINGIALGVAASHERESGVQAMRDMNGFENARPRGQGTPFSDQYAFEQPVPPRPIHPQPSYGSNAPLASGGAAPAGMWSSNSSQHSMPITSPPHAQNAYPYTDGPYNRYSSSNLNLAPQINPNDVADDDDWGMAAPPQQQKRRSFVPFGSGSGPGSGRGSRDGTPTPGVAGTAAGAAGAAATAGGVAAAGARDASGQYNAVPTGEGSQPELVQEKSEWLKQQNHGRKRLMWIVATVIAVLVIGAIVGGVLGSILTRKNNPSGGKSGGGSASPADVANDNKDDLTYKSSEIQALMNNKNLHKVFPGMDYTPLNGQYPACLTLPPSQNNITRDMAVMSQLTSAVRLYGTDCNQTEMVIESIKRLNIQKSMKVWIGVWLGNNDTTNQRQLSQMYDSLDKHKSEISLFKGIIIGNEVLFRKDLTETELITQVTSVKNNLTAKGINLPIATSDLGDNWTKTMADKVDIVMSNVHPFFAGVVAEKAAGWTWDFWTGHDVVLTKDNSTKQQIIAEVGWPSGGGNDCGETTCTSSTQGSIAGVDEMNRFMSDWICPSMKNGTEYFW